MHIVNVKVAALVQVLTEPMGDIDTDMETDTDIYYKELTNMIMQAAKFKICRWQARDLEE